MSLKEIDNDSASESGSELEGSELSEDFLNPDFASILGAQQRVASLKTPTALYGIVVPAGGEPVPIIDEDEMPHAITLTMAAVDVSESEESTKACSIKVIRRPMFEDSDDEDESDIDEEEIAMYTEEYVLCTVKPGVIYQQTLNVTFSEGEAIFFTNTGDCDVHLTGNYMTPVDEPNGQDDYDSDEDDYDSEDEDENDLIDELAEEGSEDELDDIDARIQELEDAEVESKSSKKRRASSEADFDAIMDEAAIEEPKTDKKLTKKERKKLKNANGDAVPAAAAAQADDGNASEDSSKKSVSFSNDTKPAAKKLAGGVAVEDRKEGQGPGAKKGSKISLRYVGKLTNGTTFDSNTSGKPFSFTVGSAEVIKGLDEGVIGLKIGGERRVTIPATLGYGSKALPGIPANSDLIFDIKCLKLKAK